MLPLENAAERHHHFHTINSATGIVSPSNNQTTSRKMSNGNSTPSSSAGINCGLMQRKSVLNYHHQYMSSGDNAAGASRSVDHYSSPSAGRYSPHPNELFLQHNSKLTLQPSSDDSLSCCLPPPSPAPNNDRFCGSNLTASQSNESSECFVSVHHHHHHHHQQQKQQQPHQQSLSTSTSTSSLSANSVNGPPQHQHHSSKYNISNSIISNRPVSPGSNRFRTADRFREKNPLASNGLIDNSIRTSHHTPAHAAALSNDTYSYLNASTAHTPVKRYIPTPPPAHELYTHGKNTVVAGESTSQHLCTLPYRLRIKCCDHNLGPPTTSQGHSIDSNVLSVADYYTTSPRIRPSAIGNLNNKNSIISNTPNSRDSPIRILHSDQQQKIQCGSSARPGCNFNLVVSSCPTPTSPSNLNTLQSSGNLISRQLLPSATVARLEYVGQQHNIEYMNVNSNSNNVITAASRVLSPIPMSANDNVSGLHVQNNESVSGNSTNASTCLHCNTTRRTTGVHQTTQTTGPISPIPQQQQQQQQQAQMSGISYCTQDQRNISTSTPITPATSETPMPLQSSATTFEAGNQNLRFIPQVQTSAQSQELSQSKENSSNTVISHCTQTQPSQQVMNNTLVQAQRFNTTNTRKKRLSQYMRKEVARFFGVEKSSEVEEDALWRARQRRLALRRFGSLKNERELHGSSVNDSNDVYCQDQQNLHYSHGLNHHQTSERPDILPAQDTSGANNCAVSQNERISMQNLDFQPGDLVERKPSVGSMLSSGLSYILSALSGGGKRLRNTPRQWSRSFAPAHVRCSRESTNLNDENDELYEGVTALLEGEVFFDSPHTSEGGIATAANAGITPANQVTQNSSKINSSDQNRHQIYLGERVHGWRTTSLTSSDKTVPNQEKILHQAQLNQQQQQQSIAVPNSFQNNSIRGRRISAQLLDGVLENSRRPPISHRANEKLFTIADLDDRTDYRPYFTYWINTVHILILFLSLVCYGIGPIGFGVDQRTGQVLVTSLSLQTVQHSEQRNIWIGPRNFDLIHMGSKFATCMRRDVKIVDVLFLTRRQERETACCIRNDDSGCVQSSQADCSVRGLFPTKSISTWKKWSPGESGPGGRISGSVCGLDPKYCDAPASIAPYEWPDDITKWPICRKTNSFSQRFRFKDHTAEHMICEVIGHPCCTGVFGECRITTREYCDFVNGYFHEEASLCSQISCLSNVCGMFPFFSVEVPDQLYRLVTSLCLHAGILHLAITVAFQHVFLADLERLIGPIRTAVVYICSGVAGNLTSVLLVPYKPEVGPLASLTGVVASLMVLLILMHWKQLRKPHIALLKLMFIGALLFALGTLPWQINFAGLFAGALSSVFLTIALVPFVSVAPYVRKSKINLIWSCGIFHLFFYSFMLVIFYIFPTELTNLNFGEVLTNTFNSHTSTHRHGILGDGLSNSESNMGRGGDVLSSVGQSNRQNPNFMFYSENYLVNTAASLQTINGNREDGMHNRFHHRTFSKERTNGINNLTSFKDIYIFGKSKQRFSNKNNIALVNRDLNITSTSFLFKKDRSNINIFGDVYKNGDSSSNNGTSRRLFPHNNKTNANGLGNKQFEIPQFNNEKDVYPTQEARSDQIPLKDNQDQEIAAA